MSVNVSHGWHMADAEQGIECRRNSENEYQLRYITRPDNIVTLTQDQFDKWCDGELESGLD